MPSLSEIVLLGAQQQADALRRQSDIDYNRSAQKNALWLNLGTNLAQLGTNAYMDYRKLQLAKAAAQRDFVKDERDYGIRKSELTLQEQAAERTRRAAELALTEKQQAEMLLASSLRPGLEGAPPRYDYGDMQTAAGQMKGAQTVLPGAMKTAAEQNEMFAKIDQQHLNTAAGYAYSVFRAGNTPEAYESALGEAYRRRDISQEQHDQLMAQPHDTVEKVAPITTALLSKSNDPRHMKLFEPVTMTPGSRQYVPIQGFDKPVATVPERQTFTSTDRLVNGKVTPLRESGGRYYRETGEEVQGSMPLPTAAQVNFNLGNQPPSGDFSKTGDEFLKGVPPQWQQTVKNIATYHTLPGTVLSARDAATKHMVMQWVQQYNPTFDEGVAPSRIAARKDFTSGMKSRNVVALNTAISHAGKLADLATAMQNGDTPIVNNIVNWVKTELGHSEVTNAQTAMTALAGEAATTFKSSGATDPEIAKWSAATNTSQSPKQLMDGLKTTASLFEGRFNALAGEYENVMGQKDINFLTRDARAQLQKFGIDPNTWEPEGAATVFGPGRSGGPGVGTTAQAYTGPAPMQGKAGSQWAGRYFVTIPNGPTVEVKPDGRGGWVYVTPGAR